MFKPDCIVESPDLKDGKPHPNSLRHLPPANRWDIYIDETGNFFGDDNIKEDEEKRTGKLVALAIPQGAQLKPLSAGFHAAEITKENPEQLDEVINDILESNVGVLGIQYDDRLFGERHTNWFHGVQTLIKMVLHILPLNPPQNGGNNQIHIHIEQRGDYNSKKYSLKALEDGFKTHLKRIDENKYANLGLKINFITKEGKYNGHVDTLAHCWGGGVAAQERRKKAKFSGHCFLNTQDVFSIERLYACIGDGSRLAPSDWYAVMSILDNEPKHSIFHSELPNIAKQLKKEAKWQAYFDEVDRHLKQKDYQPLALYRTLQWLKENQPKKLSLYANFRLKSALLASQNHLGRYQEDVSNDLMQLGEELYEEIAPEVANSYLRLATAKTNVYDFKTAQNILENPIFDNVIAIGRLNHIKKLSSLGQAYAFQKNYDKANQQFAQALEEIEKLKNVSQKNKERQQTDIYAILNLIDANTEFETIRQRLLKHFGTQDLQKAISKFIPQNQEDHNNTDNFNHHLLLRAFVAYPKECQALIDVYLKNEANWQTKTEHHPWQAINFWRGWLFLIHGNKQKALEYFKYAINESQELSDFTLLWIALVFMTVIKTLYPKEYPINCDELKTYLKDELHLTLAPYDKLAEISQAGNDLTKIKTLIDVCLPFNFK